MKKQTVLEKLFPNAKAREKADEAIDRLDASLPMTAFLDAWEAAYYHHAKTSPFRKKEK